MSRSGRRPRILIVGAGAAGTLTALHLTREASRRSTPVEVVLVDPADRWARGTAFGTTDDQHLLNVPASGMSALPQDPSHFLSWRQRRGLTADGYSFVPRRDWACYLDDTLVEALRQAEGEVAVDHRRTRAVAVRRDERGAAVTTAAGEEITADAVVVATGLPSAGHHWAPPSLRDSAFYVPDPWAPGALDVVRRDRVAPPGVLLVGAGLTMVDVVLTLTADDRADRVLHAVSRSGRLPHAHAPALRPVAIPDVAEWGTTLAEIRAHAAEHVAGVRRTTGDWRPAVDGLRFQVATLWDRLDEADRDTFLAEDAGGWNVLRHRMAPSSAAVVEGLRGSGRLALGTGQVRSARPLPEGGLRVTVGDGGAERTLDVGWVVNCTGPRLDVRTLGNRFLDDLLRPRDEGALAVPATAGMGVCTANGRLVDEHGSAAAPLWTLGALRRGELWESTAVPEIRSQALALATDVLDAVAPLPRRLEDGRLVPGTHPIARPRDPLGLPLSTTAEAAAAYNAGLERVMLLKSGGEDLIRQAAELDPGFALAHAALAMLGHEAGAAADVQASLAAARKAIRKRGDDRERSLVDVVGRRVRDPRGSGARALRRHIGEHPRDVLAVSAAVPTIAFSGIIDVQREAWEVVEGLAPAYGDHWWYISLLAFTRQDQGRFDEAGLLAESALSCEPASGHAVHAQTHVLYETGQHATGQEWLDHWVAGSGRSASHRAHFSWHAALHELALGDTEAVRRRYYSQLAPPAVTGVRALVDTASLLWRWQVTTTAWDDTEVPVPPIDPVLEAIGDDLLDRPGTPFTALHAALAHAASGDHRRLAALAARCRRARQSPTRTVVAPFCDALLQAGDRRWDEAAQGISALLPHLVTVGGSLAQREVVEETLLLCLLNAGRAAEARAVLDARLDRRPSPLDRQRTGALSTPAPA
ncbi:putative NAD(P)/FAD-binding protein YdhS/tetratricopeptide (TPR) repeat protein [Nocardioides thalensis]|uniref:Putative NAD(P)/FAD-binding protein YdhS/tetratricopeptide (TPR) repeat protein n=1 Tax=Nocardioides thalensis TaxID=1914755 RepID=A0A853BXF6_9ACTN|nr:FAD/NAD(P)-binding protein [Nocardioides thalensis]NYJ00610.1 putative NAD(P)/FAD-binding protein YdhS/tetratricopeptide (TPR) repeat protein [Nocardioides thalensis]